MINKINLQGAQGLAGPAKQQGGKGPGSEFLDIFKESVNKVNQNLQEADQAAAGLVSGQHNNIHETMIAMEKANVSFQMLTKAHNKVISAYQEIMRTQL